VNVHVLDDDGKGERWLIIIEFGGRRAMPTLEVRVPKICTPADVQAALAAVLRTVREKMQGGPV
jgi:hypothetical protein